ncbi:uncharacterized protein PHALS_08114 [Plasmopara halstedii]|uniref:Uncharacterized protein n=1 Tax=Plasmopara halstedii TaxID=4781 RepID=A0A0P1B747_PLAHL|nr:uncharacterized protein PHALS_08114 [Plasmopara halstedii]CEG50402.1 hypothetical protein PHALS_08114 [Plasmopara halstedii]|eukprot:XP_024586771.1 hypothetical protein PHALS_08114 [Plasmopara halstedii]
MYIELTGLVVCEFLCEGFDSTLPPDVDLKAGEQDAGDNEMVTLVSGFTAPSYFPV